MEGRNLTKMGVLQTLQLLFLAVLALGLTLFAGGCDARTSAATPDYMPLTAGRTLTYKTVDGDRFTLSFDSPRTVRWFDGTAKEVIPVRDSRCGCHVLFTEAEGQVRAVGSIESDQVARWGEYVVVWPGQESGEPEPVTTPAGRFTGARKVETGEGPVWFAPGVGIVKTRQYVLVSAGTLY